MLTDALRIVGEVVQRQGKGRRRRKRLTSLPRQGGDAGGVYGTLYHQVQLDESELDSLSLLHTLQRLFEEHTPASSKREQAERLSTAHYANNEPFALPGFRWKGAQPFNAFLQAGGLLPARGSSAARQGVVQRHDVDLIVLSVCGKGGSMDVLAFGEACAKVARKLWPDRENATTFELLTALIERHYPSAMVVAEEEDEESGDEVAE